MRFLMETFLSWTLVQGHRKESKNSSSVFFGVIVGGTTPTSHCWVPGPRRLGCGGRAPCNAWLGEQHLNLAGCCLSPSAVTSLLQTSPPFSQASCFWRMGHGVSPGNLLGRSSLPHYLHQKMSPSALGDVAWVAMVMDK